MDVEVERLRSIKNFPSLIKYLRDELDWPVEAAGFDDLIFDYEPEELGIDAKTAAKIKEIKQLRPLTTNQPWGIFFVNFEKKRLPVVMMRLILRALVLKKRESANKSERQAWQPHDLLFISAYGENDDRAITFAHFVENPGNNLAELRVLGWDDDDTPLHLDYVARMLKQKLRWDESTVASPDAWRKQWSDAFLLRHRHVVRTSQELATALAELAKRLRTRIRTVLRLEDSNGEIRKLQRAFQTGLIHDLNDDGFADMFAQTVTYGLFSVSVRRTFPGEGTAVTKDDVPNLIFTSPFLKEMLGVFLGIKSRKGTIDFDELGVSDVTDFLTSPDTHMEVVLADFNNKTRGEDPVIHFYEHFLSAYNKQLKIQRGVFYTPQPVVSYIVRSVHELLQTEFGLEDGLADTTTWGEMLKKHPGLKLPPLTDEPGEKRTISPDEPFVQILDPATGTATFLVEVIDVIHRTLAAKWKQQRLTDAQQRAAWNDYVPQHLLPRLHAFELMMAPYAIAHMKIGLKLAETGYRFGTEERARIYLTNALEPWVKQLPLIGFDALAHEAAAVNEIKRHKRFTVVIGNPPYSFAAGATQTGFLAEIMNCITTGLGVENERKKGALQDEYIRFIALSRYILNATKMGVLGLITNNSYLDGTLHRAMRKSLMEAFPRLDVANLHGSSRAGTGEAKDENVFDIMQGVAVVVASRRYISSSHESSTTTSVRYGELIGSRDAKYQALNMGAVKLVALAPSPPYHLLRPLDSSHFDEYEKLVSLRDAFIVFSSGIETEKDHFAVDFEVEPLRQRLSEFCDLSLTPKDVVDRFDLKTTPNWDLVQSRKAISKEGLKRDLFTRYLFHCFDWRFTYYSDHLVTRARRPVMGQMRDGNLALITLRQVKGEPWAHAFATNDISNKFTLSSKSSNVSYHFPLWVTGDDSKHSLALQSGREPNFAPAFLKSISIALKSPQKSPHGLPAGLAPEDIFHYAYAVFHSPGYRSRYAEFLKIDFPRLPLTGNLELFRALARLGGELTALHLLESPKLAQPITEFIGGRHPEVEKISWSRHTVWVDKAQTTGFQGVREDVWNFHIGGYQVCEKWLKDRKGRTLTKDDIAHYHKIVVALSETIRLMREIDEVIEKHGGWPGAFATAEPPQSEGTLPFA